MGIHAEVGCHVIPFPAAAVVRCPPPVSDELLVRRLAISVAIDQGWLEPAVMFDADGNELRGYRYTPLGLAEVGDGGVVAAAVAFAKQAEVRS